MQPSPASLQYDDGVIVGAGLGGCMMALLLAQKGKGVVVLEGREDWRVKPQQVCQHARVFTAFSLSLVVMMIW